MATRAENATTTIDQWWARLTELDAVPITQRARMNYTDDNGRSFGWSGYRESIVAAIEKMQSARAGESSLEQQAGGIFTVLG